VRRFIFAGDNLLARAPPAPDAISQSHPSRRLAALEKLMSLFPAYPPPLAEPGDKVSSRLGDDANPSL